jgi:hypothetical protein
VIDAGRDSNTQKSPDLVPRKRVGYNPLLGRTVLILAVFNGISRTELSYFHSDIAY